MAKVVLEGMQEEIEEFLSEQKINLNIRGVGDFKMNERESQVLFVKVGKNKGFEVLMELVDWVVERLVSEGVLEENEVKRDPVHLALVNSSLMITKNGLRGFNGKGEVLFLGNAI